MRRNNHVDVCASLLVGVLLVGLILPAAGLARNYKGVEFPDECIVGGQTCKLVGIGLREKFFFDIYYGALYLAQPTSERGDVVTSEQAKRVVLHVLYRKIGPSKWIDGWREGFEKTVPNPGKELATRIQEFLNCFDEPVMRGQRVRISYIPGKGTEVEINGKVKGTIAGRDFMIALWNIWFGDKPASRSLMEGMLGK